MNIDEIKDELIKYGKFLFQKDLSPATSGNISARYGEGCLISATGTCLGDLKREDIVLIDFDGNLLDDGKKPSSEKFLHIDTYKKRTDVNAVFHCHSPYTTAFAVAHREMSEPILSEFVYYFNKLEVAKYAAPGSLDLVKNTTCFLESSNAVLMANHGVIVCAKDIPTAFYYVDTIESYAKIYLHASQLGNISSLGAEDVEFIRNMP